MVSEETLVAADEGSLPSVTEERMATYSCKLTIPVGEIKPYRDPYINRYLVGMRFTAVLTDKLGTAAQAKHTHDFTIVLNVLGTFNDPPWSGYSPVDRNKHLFAYLRERLQRDGLPEDRSVEWDTDQEMRFAEGPPYSFEHIHPWEAFEIILGGERRNGFSQE